jgi:hypothetical protein
MDIPQDYKHWLATFPFREISFGYAGMKIYSPAELDEGQIGYSRSSEGESFCNSDPAAWKTEWIVIGYDTLSGDPLILDTAKRNFPIMTDMNGQGTWNPRIIANSLDAFAFGLNTIHRLSAGREDPVKLEQNPLAEEELELAVNAIRAKNNGDIDLEFWLLMLASEP